MSSAAAAQPALLPKKTKALARKRVEDSLENHARKSSKGEAPSTSWKKYGLDPDTLECPICAEPFSPPVFQCENGHTACSVCCKKITNGCPSCSQPIGRIRCIAIEKVIESLQVECEHAPYGCNTMVKCSERDEHENNLCEYRPIECPIQIKYDFKKDCTHIGPKVTIPMHLAQEHNWRIVECSESTRSASLNVDVTELWGVMFKAKEAWLLVSWQSWDEDDRDRRCGFYCNSFVASKEVEYKLTVKPVQLNRESKKVYTMQDVARALLPAGGEEYDYLLLPGKEAIFELTLSLV